MSPTCCHAKDQLGDFMTDSFDGQFYAPTKDSNC